MNKNEILEKIRKQVLQPEYVGVVGHTAMVLHNLIPETDGIRLCVLEGLEFDSIIHDNTINVYIGMIGEIYHEPDKEIEIKYETLEFDGLKLNVQTKENLYEIYKCIGCYPQLLKILEENGGIK